MADILRTAMSDNMVNLFTARGVTFLFPIQAKTFHHVYSGKDLIAQARTGTGKTFSFAIPLIEKLLGGMHDRKRGRAPQVTQTRPQGLQMHTANISWALFTACCFVLGSS